MLHEARERKRENFWSIFLHKGNLQTGTSAGYMPLVSFYTP